MDKTGLQFVVEDGRRSKAEELQEMVIQDTGLSEEAREIFSLWLMSPLLGKFIAFFVPNCLARNTTGDYKSPSRDVLVSVGMGRFTQSAISAKTK
jgi:phosphate/sulfate permease